LIYFLAFNINGEIVTDGTLGQQINLLGTDFQITPNLGQQHGSNLFHSFQDFNLNSSESAIFSGPNSVQNVISRVTGGNLSNIDGLIRSTIPNANMYFLNPNGIIFGQNARLDLQGSFYASTADYLKLGGQGRFEAYKPDNSSLTIAAPSAFGFLDNDIGSIEVNNSFLEVSNSKTLALFGGDISITTKPKPLENNEEIGILKAGNIGLISTESNSEFTINPDIFSYDNIKLGNITITGDSSNISRNIGNIDTTSTGSGKIFILAEQLDLDNGYIFSDTNGNGIDIKITNAINMKNASRITAASIEGATGNGGYIHLTSNEISLENGSLIASNTFSKNASAGNITIDAIERLFIYGYYGRQPSAISAKNYSENESTIGGNINIKTDKLIMERLGEINTLTKGFGNAGNIDLQVNKLSIQNLAQIKAGTGNFKDTKGKGYGGNIFVKARDSILISGGMKSRHSGLQSNTFTAGQGGTIEILTPKLTIQNGGAIQAVARKSGNAGNIGLDNINLMLYDAIIITDSDKTSGGNIKINTNNLLYSTNSIFNAESRSEHFGDSGGNVILDEMYLTVLDKSLVLARGFISDGGNIKIKTEHFVKSFDSKLDASSKFGVDGKVIINTPNIDFTGSLKILPTTFFDASNLLENSCATDGSSLLLNGRTGLSKVFLE